MYVRPDNLTGGVEDLRMRLKRLGLEDDALVFRADQFGGTGHAHIRTLWQGMGLNQVYKDLSAQLDNWLDNMNHLSPDQAAREIYLLGRPAIRQVVFDPLLPEGMVDTHARQACFETIRRFDTAGRAIWWRFFQFSEAPPHTGA